MIFIYQIMIQAYRMLTNMPNESLIFIQKVLVHSLRRG